MFPFSFLNFFETSYDISKSMSNIDWTNSESNLVGFIVLKHISRDTDDIQNFPTLVFWKFLFCHFYLSFGLFWTLSHSSRERFFEGTSCIRSLRKFSIFTHPSLQIKLSIVDWSLCSSQNCSSLNLKVLGLSVFLFLKRITGYHFPSPGHDTCEQFIRGWMLLLKPFHLHNPQGFLQKQCGEESWLDFRIWVLQIDCCYRRFCLDRKRHRGSQVWLRRWCCCFWRFSF